MRRFVYNLLALAALAPVTATAAPNVTNTVLMVDQHGNLNVPGIASVETVASNAAKVVVAEQKAEIARQTADTVSNSMDIVIVNLMANNEVIYRSGFSDAFAPLVQFGPDDKLAMAEARWLEQSASRLVVEVDYVCTRDMGTIKPTVMHRETLSVGGGRNDFSELADANVTQPTYHVGPRTVGDDTYSGYYTIQATIPNPVSYTSYFLWIKADADAPTGDGATLDIAGGITGGVSDTVTWGDKTLTFVGGVLMEVE